MDPPLLAPPPKPTSSDEFRIAIICALPLEANAVGALFDSFYGDQEYKKVAGDGNAYITGVIGCHNVTLAYMPNMGELSAAVVATGLKVSFRGIKLALVVGICGGVPYRSDGVKEILLGDVIISNGAVQYDHGSQLPDGFKRKTGHNDTLGRQNPEIRSFLSKISVEPTRKGLTNRTHAYLTELCMREGFEETRYPGVDNDKLYESTYRHKHHSNSCAICEGENDKTCEQALKASCSDLKCDETRVKTRKRLSKAKEFLPWAPKPDIHLGFIATGNQVMKSGEHRDEIATMEDVIAFEMEAAGVWDMIPCIIIKGVCDYADSHKNKKWQVHAAATAAACTKAFLEVWIESENSSQPLPSPNSLSISGFSTPSTHTRHLSEENQINAVPVPLRDDFQVSMELGNQCIVGKNPSLAARHFKHALSIWTSTKTGGAVAYIKVYNGLTDCAIQMTYKKTVLDTQMYWIEKAAEYTGRAHDKVCESTDPRDLLRVLLDQTIIKLRRVQIRFENENLKPEQGERIRKRFEGIVMDLRLLSNRGYDANGLLEEANLWMNRIY